MNHEMDKMDTTLEMERFFFLIDPFCTSACSAKVLFFGQLDS